MRGEVLPPNALEELQHHSLEAVVESSARFRVYQVVDYRVIDRPFPPWSISKRGAALRISRAT